MKPPIPFDSTNIIEMHDIIIDYQMKKYDIRAITDVNLNIKKGKITALVGESGSGKTTIASAILQVISAPGKLVQGSIEFNDTDESETQNKIVRVDQLTLKEINAFRWEKVSMVFQAAQSALNPVMSIYDQFYETAQAHHPQITHEEVKKRAIDLFHYVKLDVDRVFKAYPHELSGGMKQRVMIAFSLLLNPKFIILDEPTTALDVITQDYIFRILKDINREMGISMLLMTHDIGVVAKFADYVGVMYAGRLVEFGTVEQVFVERKHPYTRGLIAATPSLKGDRSKMKPISGSPPDLRQLPQGCKFYPRCEFALAECQSQEPETYLHDGSCVKCFLYR